MTDPRRSGPTATSRVLLHELAIRADRDEWLVGRFETRVFVALPEAGVAAIEILASGASVIETTRHLAGQRGTEFDVLAFVADLTELGFVAEIDDCPVPSAPPLPPTLPRLRPEYVRYALHPILPVLLACLVVAAAVTVVRMPQTRPGFRDLLWSSHGGLVLVTGFVFGWSLLFLHELAHFAAARAAGVRSRIQLGTRLQFLVAETDISGIELAPRRHRITAYSAGIAVNLAVASTAVLLQTVVTEHGLAHRLLAAATILALLPLSFQLMVFMRTDLYFVLQDLTGCRDLYGDGRAYARYLCNRGRHAVIGHRWTAADPSLNLPRHERRAVRVYSVVLVLGTALCLTVAATYTLPADVTLLIRAIQGIAAARSGTSTLDSAVVLVILGIGHTLWAVTWWRRRRERSTAAGPS
ncbi:hypothetical protein [Nocardia testacea]|uniref:hypothetical protein n=1 Tax=Nocardia testacea TaxID=248551 RepID=UPI000684BCA2|nr:hypothetical protein [Nocardia testacea]